MKAKPPRRMSTSPPMTAPSPRCPRRSECDWDCARRGAAAQPAALAAARRRWRRARPVRGPPPRRLGRSTIRLDDGASTAVARHRPGPHRRRPNRLSGSPDVTRRSGGATPRRRPGAVQLRDAAAVRAPRPSSPPTGVTARRLGHDDRHHDAEPEEQLPVTNIRMTQRRTSDGSRSNRSATPPATPAKIRSSRERYRRSFTGNLPPGRARRFRHWR